MYALESVKVGEVEEVPYPTVDAQQVERGRRDEVQRDGIGVKERAQVRKAAQQAALLGLGSVHARRPGDWGTAVGATAVGSQSVMQKVCTRSWQCGKCGVQDCWPG